MRDNLEIIKLKSAFIDDPVQINKLKYGIIDTVFSIGINTIGVPSNGRTYRFIIELDMLPHNVNYILDFAGFIERKSFILGKGDWYVTFITTGLLTLAAEDHDRNIAEQNPQLFGSNQDIEKTTSQAIDDVRYEMHRLGNLLIVPIIDGVAQGLHIIARLIEWLSNIGRKG